MPDTLEDLLERARDKYMSVSLQTIFVPGAKWRCYLYKRPESDDSPLVSAYGEGPSPAEAIKQALEES